MVQCEGVNGDQSEEEALKCPKETSIGVGAVGFRVIPLVAIFIRRLGTVD